VDGNLIIEEINERIMRANGIGRSGITEEDL
jgi:hypothetical protein